MKLESRLNFDSPRYCLLVTTLAILGFGLWATVPVAAQTATLRGQFKYNGEAPDPVKLTVNKDIEVCGKHEQLSQAIVVGPNGELEGVALWLYTKGVEPPEDLADAPEEPAVLDNKDCRFVPHVLLMRAGQPLQITNSDPVGHNTMGTPRGNRQFNVLIPVGGSQTIDNLNKPERLPFKAACSIHPWMSAWIVLVDTPYAAVSGEDGTFEISGLPAGQELEFQAWQESAGYVKDVTVDGKKSDWKFGRFKMTLQPGMNDMGQILVAPASFKK